MTELVECNTQLHKTLQGLWSDALTQHKLQQRYNNRIVVGKGSGLGGTLGAGTREHAQAWAFAVADKASSLVQVPDQSPSCCIWNADALSPHYMQAKD